MFKEIFELAIREGISDIHITANETVALRKFQKIYKTDRKLSSKEVEDFAKLISGELYQELLDHRQLDLGGSIHGVRYRANIYFQRGELALALRIINNKVKTFAELNLPKQLLDIVKHHHGLILVTGPTGSGKSTTLAAMIDEINSEYEKHIITIEDPVEYVHENKKSIIHQRELGADLHSFDEGLKAVLRQDPDVIMLGELRDKLTVNTALKASETGHLVLSTLHTSDVKSTINRIGGLFSSDEVDKVRTLLADSLVAIISQRLIKRLDGRGVVPAFEIMVNTTATANIIRKGESAQLDSYLLMDQRIGSISMDKSLESLVKRKIIAPIN